MREELGVPIGDITTIMLWIKGNITAGKIILETFIPSLISMLVPLIIITFTMKGEYGKTTQKMIMMKINQKITRQQSNTYILFRCWSFAFLYLYSRP
jgi:Na+/H+ antiporter NhaD/arsenite permease-like protein